MPSRRDALLIIAAALVLALLAWVLLTSGSSDAPGSEPGAGVLLLTRLVT